MPLAHGLGATKTSQSASVTAGDNVEFKIVLFSKSSAYVSFVYDLPEDWGILIEPDELVVPSESNEYVVLDGEYIMASPVYITISVPYKAEGDYEVIVTAQTKGGEGIGVSQEIDFSFKINVLNTITTTTKQSDYVTTTIFTNETEPELIEEIGDKEDTGINETDLEKTSTTLTTVTTIESGITGMVTADPSTIIILAGIILSIIGAVIYLKI